jgi:hypothetical protein
MIELDREIQQVSDFDSLKPILRLIVRTINTQSDAKTQVRGDMAFHDGGPVLRATDGNYYRLSVEFLSGVPTMGFTNIGKNPIGEK